MTLLNALVHTGQNGGQRRPGQTQLLLQGAGQVITIDHHPRRLGLAKQNGAEVLNYLKVKVREALGRTNGQRSS